MASRGKKYTRTRRHRAALMMAEPLSKPLFKTRDYGNPIGISAKEIGAVGNRWVEPFLSANKAFIRRLNLRVEILADTDLQVLFFPGSRIGAIPLLHPATRKVAAGLLVEPRFQWSNLGAVFNAIGFSVEPTLGGAPLVPGSAREVPPWVLAGPVIERVAKLLQHRRRGFVERFEIRQSPRGRVQWTSWAKTQVPSGQWTQFPCTFSEPDDDPNLIATIRWTLLRLREELHSVAHSLPGRFLLNRTKELLHEIGPGTVKHPVSTFIPKSFSSEWVSKALEAMMWVAEERGLGGARSLDGLAWDISVDSVWEAWIASFAASLGPRLGMTASPFASTRRPLLWQGAIHSMGSLAPDVELRGSDRIVWIDAKYKAHLELLAHHRWSDLSEEVRSEHRADLHQALAYASLADVSQVDTLLLYPHIGQELKPLTTAATLTSGHRRVRLILASVPFGYKSQEQESNYLDNFREILQEPCI